MKLPPDRLPQYDEWDDGVMSNDVDQLLRRIWAQREESHSAARVLATIDFWRDQLVKEKVPGKPVISPERMHRFVGDERDFALVRDKEGKPVERDDPRNAELKNSGPKKRTKK
jgi:hypothetical protein